MNQDMKETFGEVIHSYSRAQAIEDGVLVDVTKIAKEAGFVYPVALTRTVWNRYVEVPEGVIGQDVIGRLWDVVWMCWIAAKRAKDNQGEMLFKLHVRNDGRTATSSAVPAGDNQTPARGNRDGLPPLITLKAHCGPGDQAEPVVTIMLPDED